MDLGAPTDLTNVDTEDFFRQMNEILGPLQSESLLPPTTMQTPTMQAPPAPVPTRPPKKRHPPLVPPMRGTKGRFVSMMPMSLNTSATTTVTTNLTASGTGSWTTAAAPYPSSVSLTTTACQSAPSLGSSHSLSSSSITTAPPTEVLTTGTAVQPFYMFNCDSTFGELFDKFIAPKIIDPSPITRPMRLHYYRQLVLDLAFKSISSPPIVGTADEFLQKFINALINVNLLS